MVVTASFSSCSFDFPISSFGLPPVFVDANQINVSPNMSNMIFDTGSFGGISYLFIYIYISFFYI
jgi:hypothetical protein